MAFSISVSLDTSILGSSYKVEDLFIPHLYKLGRKVPFLLDGEQLDVVFTWRNLSMSHANELLFWINAVECVLGNTLKQTVIQDFNSQGCFDGMYMFVVLVR
jgi:hypothetical protein